MTAWELDPSHFDGSADIAELTDFLFAEHVPQSDVNQTPNESIVQVAKNMAVTWVQYGANHEPIGWRYKTDQFIREGRALLRLIDGQSEGLPKLLVLAGNIAEGAADTDNIHDEDRFMRDATTQLKAQLLIDRFRATGFELPEVDAGDVFSEHWKTWRRYGTRPIQ